MKIMIETLISSAVLIVVTAVLRCILRGKVRNTAIYSLWLIAAVRLMIPHGLPESSMSIMNFQRLTAEKSSVSFVENEPKSHSPVISEKNPEPESDTKKMPDTISIAEKNETIKIIPIIWLSGTCLCLTWFTVVNTIFYIRLRRCRAKYKKIGRLNVYIADSIGSPCVFGIIKPSIYLNNKAIKHESNIDYVISHEFSHYKHGDLIWSVLRCILVSVYWFDPFVWTGAYLSKLDCEYACDESVIRNLSYDRRIEYGRVLLSMANSEKRELFGNISTAMTAGGKRLKERIILITKKSKNSAAAIAIMLTAVLMTMSCTFTTAAKHNTATPSIPVNNSLDNRHYEKQTDDATESNEAASDRYQTIDELMKNENVPKMTSEDIAYWRDYASEIYNNGTIIYNSIVQNGNYFLTDSSAVYNEGGMRFEQVTDTEISSVSELKAIVRTYFSESLALQFDPLIDIHYKNINGKLYQSSACDELYSSYFDMDFSGAWEDKMYFVVNHYSPDSGEYISSNRFTLINENNAWKILVFA